VVVREQKISDLLFSPCLVSILVTVLTGIPLIVTTSARAHECPEFSFAQPEEGPLAALNCDFHKRYEDRIAQTIATFGAVGGRPVILSLSGKLLLKRNGGTEVVDINPPSFDQIKALAHSSFAVALALSQVPPGALRAELKEKLRVQRAHLDAALAELPNLSLPIDAETPCRELVVLTRDFIDGVLMKGSWTQTELAAYHTQVMPLFLRTIDVAAAIELKMLDSVVSHWLVEMTREERARLGVVVATVHQARANHRVMQYFERKLGRPTGVGAQRENGLICLEGKFDEASAVALLARHYVDREAAQMILGDPSRLQRDLLADTAALLLRDILPQATPIEGLANGVPDQPDISVGLAKVGARFRMAIPVSNNPVVVKKIAGRLPPGIRFDQKTGILSGTPTAPGCYQFLLQGANAVGHAAPTTMLITVTP
jgi:hypothetical protein